MNWGFKRIRHDREIREAVCVWFSLSIVAAGFSCCILAFFKRAADTSFPLALKDARSIIASIPLASYLGVGIGTLFAMMLWFVYIEFRNKKLLQRYLSCLTERFNWSNFKGGLLISIAATVISGCAYFAINFSDGNNHGAMHFILDNPGGIFAILTGFATIIGTYIAVQSILELKHTITSFPQLIDRVIFMIENNEHKKEPVFILAYSPLSGAWNIDPGQQSRLRGAITADRSKVQLICLSENDHLELLIKVARKGTFEKGKIPAGDVVEFQKHCKGVIEKLAAKGNINYGGETRLADAAEFATMTKTLPKSEMPGFYFYVSETRAIVVSPVGIPLNGVATGEGTERHVEVETLGFETTDRHIIKILRTEFKKFEAIGIAYPQLGWADLALETVQAMMPKQPV